MNVGTRITLCFSLSLTFLLVGFIAWRGWASYENKKKSLASSEGAFRPFYCLAIGMLAAGLFMFFPFYYFNYFGAEGNFVTFVKSMGLALHNTMRMFIMDGEFDPIRQIIEYTVEDAEGNAVFVISEINRQAMSIFGISVFVLAPIVTFGTVISFFKNLIAKFAYSTTVFRDIYVMSELNERSLALAENIVLSKGKRRKLVIFADVFEDDEEMYELVTKAHRLGAICFSSDVSEIGLKPRIPQFLNTKRRVFFISMDEDSNLEKALAYIPQIRDKKRLNNRNTAVYVFVKSAESDPLLDSVDHGDIRVRRVDENRNFAIDVVRKYPIFDRAIEAEGTKIINVAIIGLGTIGTELLKTIVWSGQMIGYELNVHIFHSGDNAEQTLRAIAPELVESNKEYVKNGRVKGNPFYKIYYHNKTDVKTAAFLDEVKKVGRITTAYVTLGDDELDIETAMRLRMAFIRNGYSGDSAPQILAVVFSNVKADAISYGNGLSTVDALSSDEIRRVSYDIEIIGSLSSINSLDMIEQLDLEDRALECHMSYDREHRVSLLAKREDLLKALETASGEEKSDLEEKLADLEKEISDNQISAELSEKRFWSFAHYRNSSKATALHIELKNYLGFTAEAAKSDPELAIRLRDLEHERWMAYMLAEGYVYGEKKDFIAKTNPSIVPTHDLHPSEIDIDAAVISDVDGDAE